VRHQVERLTDAYLNQVMPLEEYQRRRQGLEQRLQALARQEEQLAAEAQRQHDVAGVMQAVEAFCTRVQGGLQQATWEQRRQLVELLIDRVVVTDADVEIRSVIPTTPASEHVRFCHVRSDYRARLRLSQRPALPRLLGLLKKPERIMALSLVMVLCLLVYRLAEHRLREQLAATGQTIPDQVKKPTPRPTMRWVFQCFEGIELLHIRHGPAEQDGRTTTALILRLTPLHQQILALLGPPYEQFYESSN
jgi:hypothetical protein